MTRVTDHTIELGEVIVPDGVSGPWAIESFEITKEQADHYNLWHMADKQAYHAVQPGRYKRLVLTEGEERHVVMSNTPMEVVTNLTAAAMATGRVLINGLGLGMILHHILQKPEVTEVIVVERDDHVLRLVAPTFQPNEKLVIVHADAFEYEPEGLFDFVWHDIWTFISDENLEQMDRLEAKYSPIAKAQLCWARHDCEQMQQQMDEMLSFVKLLRGDPK